MCYFLFFFFHSLSSFFFCFFFFNDTATTEIYTLSLHDALPICLKMFLNCFELAGFHRAVRQMQSAMGGLGKNRIDRSEEHTSELQSRLHLVCRLLLEKKKKNKLTHTY